jgi:hypothetical protein
MRESRLRFGKKREEKEKSSFPETFEGFEANYARLDGNIGLKVTPDVIHQYPEALYGVFYITRHDPFYLDLFIEAEGYMARRLVDEVKEVFADGYQPECELSFGEGGTLIGLFMSGEIASSYKTKEHHVQPILVASCKLTFMATEWSKEGCPSTNSTMSEVLELYCPGCFDTEEGPRYHMMPVLTEAGKQLICPSCHAIYQVSIQRDKDREKVLDRLGEVCNKPG